MLKCNFYCWLAICLLTSSCTTLYLPNQVNTPMLSQKNEFVGNVAFGTSYFNTQLAYSPVKNIGVMANMSTLAKKQLNPKSDFLFFAEGGAGYYHSLDKNWQFDVYAGGGYGNRQVNITDPAGIVSTTGQYSRMFIQPSMGYKSNYFDGNLSMRTCWVNMLENKTTRSSTIFMEPTMTLKYGWQYIKVINQIGMSVPLTSFSYGYNPLILNLGISINIREFELKAAKPKSEE